MAILGNNVKGGGGATNTAGGRKYVSRFTLATASILSELHGWFTGSGPTIQLVIYADSGGLPGARRAYTSPLTPTGGDVELSQTGFSVSLAAGDYWIGWAGQDVGGVSAYFGAVGDYQAQTSGAAYNPPSDPFGTPDGSGTTRAYSCWAVVTAAGSPPVANFTATPLTGNRPLSVAFTDTSTNTPTSWAWTFGDGGTSSVQNPSHTYAAGGTYTVTLVATNAAGSNTKTRTAYITVANPSGTLTKIKWGNNLVVTDQGSGVILVDGITGGSSFALFNA